MHSVIIKSNLAEYRTKVFLIAGFTNFPQPRLPANPGPLGETRFIDCSLAGPCNFKTVLAIVDLEASMFLGAVPGAPGSGSQARVNNEGC